MIMMSAGQQRKEMAEQQCGRGEQNIEFGAGSPAEPFRKQTEQQSSMHKERSEAKHGPALTIGQPVPMVAMGQLQPTEKAYTQTYKPLDAEVYNSSGEGIVNKVTSHI